jgi:hypothetical protein
MVGIITRAAWGSNNRRRIFAFEILDRGFLSCDAGDVTLTCPILTIMLFRRPQCLTPADLFAE